jgi:hypothetical protein
MRRDSGARVCRTYARFTHRATTSRNRDGTILTLRRSLKHFVEHAADWLPVRSIGIMQRFNLAIAIPASAAVVRLDALAEAMRQDAAAT